MCANAPTFSEFAGHIADILRGRAVIAHNAKFDLGMLGAEFSRLGVKIPSLTHICTADMTMDRGFRPWRLENCCRLGELVNETQTLCYAWALISNHFHLLVKTGRVPVATRMRRLLTCYAMGFNHRHRRSGHVFQNSYKSILWEQDVYLKELIRYIHLNFLRARIVKDIKSLDTLTEIGNRLNISVSTVSVAVKKGQQIIENEGLKLVDLLVEILIKDGITNLYW
jgi:REP element-mobilizing transposase RayT